MFRVRTRTRQPRRIATVAVIVVLALVASGTSAVAAPASSPKPNKNWRPPVSAGPAVTSVTALRPHFTKGADQKAPNYAAPMPVWPAAGTAQIALAAPTGAARSGSVAHATGTPLWAAAQRSNATESYRGPRSLRVQMLGHPATAALGVTGAVFSVDAAGGAAGTVRVGVDYAAFARAYGGDFGDRLRLVEMPACALTTPDLASCRRATRLPATNDSRAQTVSAPVSFDAPSAAPAGPATAAPASGMVVLALTSDPGTDGGNAGSYAATSLKPSGSWAQSGSTGSFTYSYPITVPPAASDLVPSLDLSYSSGSVDGQTATTQAQSSWVGDGWSAPDSYIEQSFAACSDSPEGSPSPVSTSDQCYDGPVFTLSLNGSTTSLVWDAINKVFRAQDDNGEVITHYCTTTTDPTCVKVTTGNGETSTYDQDWFTVTETDGTSYSFGLNELPGWTSGKTPTNSVSWEPVYSAHPGDPCYSSTGFTASVCNMGYRWGLDYVKDPHQNAIAYYYQRDTNKYGEDNGTSNVTYIRDTHLDHIDYGFVDGGAYGTPPNRIKFTTGDRCVTGTCDPLNATTAPNWPDVPFDLVCSTGTCQSWSPSFFSTVRLTTITAQQWSTTAANYVPIDTYALSQSLPTVGDNTTITLWLDSITRTASDPLCGAPTCPAITYPTVTFGKVPLANRVDDVTDGLTALQRYRIASITTETGSVITVVYNQPNPCTAPVTLTPSTNTKSCYPVYWTPAGFSQPFLDWFNQFTVHEVTQSDPTGGAPGQATFYNYSGGAAWHYDDNEVTKAKYRTYGQFRGYATVQTLLGDGVNDPQAETDTSYYRGMSDDNNTTTVTLTDSQGGTHEDVNQLAGNTLESITHLGAGGPVDHSSITSYWVSAATATRPRSPLPDLTANQVAPAETYTTQALTDNGGGANTTWQHTETDTTYDPNTANATFGLPTYSYQHSYPVNTAYDSCTATTYAPANTAANIVGLAAETETDSVACGGFTEGTHPSAPAALNTLTAPAAVTRPDQVVADTRTFYDDPSFSSTFPQTTAPTAGDVTMTREAKDYTPGSGYTWQTTAETTYDSYGRVLTATNGNGNTTTSSYTMNSVGLTTATSVSNALHQATSTTLDPARGLTLTAKDPNNIVTTSQYDAAGRVTSVWLANRYTPTTPPPANYLYTYQLQNNGPTTVTSKTMNEGLGYQTSVAILDGLLRARQTQTTTATGNGRLISDTFYDSRGWTNATYSNWWDPATLPTAGPPVAPTQVTPPPPLPQQDFFTYDGLGRVVVDTSEHDFQVDSTTTTVYNGDATTTIPPTGGVTQTTRTDPLDRTTGLDQYSAAPTLNPPASTFTGIYTISGGTKQATSYGYDGHGNQYRVTDPGGATWTSTYNILGEITRKQDPDGGDTGVDGLQYDADGNLQQSTDGRGKTISFTYDALDRKTGQYDATYAGRAGANQMAAWVYDNSNNVTGITNPIGKLTTETSYIGGTAGAAYTIQQQKFNLFGESLGETVTIPAAEGTALGKSYSFTHAYGPKTGLLASDTYVAAGGLPSETVNHSYTGPFDLPDAVGGAGGYAEATAYDAWGRVGSEILGPTTSESAITNHWDTHTGRLKEQTITRQIGTPATVDDQQYTYDLAGNITKQISTRLDSGATSETQCFQYTPLDQLSAAWTATDDCAATPTSADHAMVADNLGASSAYWTTWTFNTDGQRAATAGQIQHSLTGGADTTTNYTYNGNGTNQAHTLTATATTGGATGSTSYHYDAAGNMTSRNAGNGNQTLAWNDADQLTQISGSTGGTTSYIYDADGNVLLQKDPGTTTLYLPGEQLALNTATQAVTGTRYYPLPSGATAVRTGTGTNYTLEITDQHNTGTLTLDPTAQNLTWRQQTPYGNPRGNTVTWIDNRGFLNQPADTDTGLTQLGARQYDPTTATFTSLDPQCDQNDPQSLNGYTYADNNPILKADPTGLSPKCNADGDCQTGTGAYDTTNYQAPQGHGCTSDTTCDHTIEAHQGPHKLKLKTATTTPTHKHKHWWDSTVHFVEKHADAVGLIAGIAVGAACEFGTMGLGTIGCGALAGLTSGLVTDGLGVASGDESWTQFGINVATDTLAGALAGGIAGKLASLGSKAAEGVAADTNKIYSARVLQRMANEPGPMHNFPGSFDDEIFANGTKSVNPNYYDKAKPNLGNDSFQYRLPGSVNGKSGTFEIFTRPSSSGRSELVMHRFFRPGY